MVQLSKTSKISATDVFFPTFFTILPMCFPWVLPSAASKFPTFSAHEIEGKKVGDQVIWHGAAKGCDKPWNILEPLGTWPIWCQKKDGFKCFLMNPKIHPLGALLSTIQNVHGCLGWSSDTKPQDHRNEPSHQRAWVRSFLAANIGYLVGIALPLLPSHPVKTYMVLYDPICLYQYIWVCLKIVYP